MQERLLKSVAKEAGNLQPKDGVGENHMKTSRLIFVAPIFLLLGSGGVYAQSSVDARVQKLEDSIQVLERRVAALEDQVNKQAPARVASDKVNWRKLQKGISESDVEQLLGSPAKVDAFGTFTVWHYGDALGGRVEFDNRRTVTGWHEP
jgi:uncharacterized Ntn-hydrolase superfamily protein